MAEKPAPCYNSYCGMQLDALEAMDRSGLSAGDRQQYEQALKYRKSLAKHQKQKDKNIAFYYKKVDFDFTGPDGNFRAFSSSPYEVTDPFFASGENASETYFFTTSGDAQGAQHSLSATVDYDIDATKGLGVVDSATLWKGYEAARFKDGTAATVRQDSRSIDYCHNNKRFHQYSTEFYIVYQCTFYERPRITIPHERIVHALEHELPIDIYLTSPKGPTQHYILPPSFLAAHIRHIHDQTGLFADNVTALPALQHVGSLMETH
ncbi:hypothetical protein [Kordiimonas sp.]|uniref:hypothetical protein n=1 Tax=Kordiimonas sp. TaxID=1970157 RepID=UPI003A9413E4